MSKKSNSEYTKITFYLCTFFCRSLVIFHIFSHLIVRFTILQLWYGGIGDFYKIRLYNENKKELKSLNMAISKFNYQYGLNYVKSRESKDCEFLKKISKVRSSLKKDMDKIKGENVSQDNEFEKLFDKELKDLNTKFDDLNTKFDEISKLIKESLLKCGE